MPDDIKDRPKISIDTTHYAGFRGTDVHFRNLTPDESEMLQGAARGMRWFSFENGRLVFRETYQGLPFQVPDEKLLEFWGCKNAEPSQLELFEFEPLRQYDDPALVMQHIIAHAANEELYAREAERVASWGFECLRSRRGPEGRYWELWYLPGAWCAKGDLKEAIGLERDSRKRVERMISFLQRKGRFGTLDIAVQRLAAAPPD